MKYFNGTIVYLTTGFKKDVVFQVQDKSASKLETQVLFSDARKQYEEFFGEGVWNQSIDNVSFEEYAKNQIKSKLIRIKCMNLLAKERGVVLDKTETANVEKAAKEYIAGQNSDQIAQFGITETDIITMYTEFAIAQRLFNDMTSQVAVEVSADQARVINIQYICSNSLTDINNAKTRVDAGDNFFYVAREINSDGQYEYELKRGEMDKVFEDTAFELKTGQTSNVIQCGDKYYIIKCISDNNKTKTEANRNTIISEQKLNAFNHNFESYEASLFVNFNHKLWDSMKIVDSVKTSVGFEDIFNNYFK